MRNALLEGNGAIAPVALEQPPALTPEQSADLAMARFPLTFPRISRFAVVFTLIIVIITVGQIVLVVTTLHRVPATSFYDSFTTLMGVFQLVYGIFIGEKIIAIYAGPQIMSYGWSAFLPMRRPRVIAVDEWGIRWQPRSWRRREQILAWQDVVSFCLHRHKSGYTSKTAYSYILLSNEVAFAWIVPARANDAERFASALLCQLAVAHSGRPMRDVTASADILSAWEAPISSKPKAHPTDREPRKSLLAALTALREGDGGPSSPFGVERARPRPAHLRPRFYWLNALALLVVILGLCGGWLFAHHQAESYLGAWPARIASETPLFSDPLTSNTHGWPVHAPTSDDPMQLGFTNGGYTINSGPDYTDHVVWQNARYANVAVAATVRMQETSEYGADVGLVARVEDGAYQGIHVDEIILDVNPLVGTWSLTHERPPRNSNDDGWSLLTVDNTSAAIHTGVGVPNRLMLVVAGAMDYAYANGQFLGSVYDPYATAPAPQSGYVGLWTLGLTTATFNDFAIYPALPPYQLLPGGW